MGAHFLKRKPLVRSLRGLFPYSLKFEEECGLSGRYYLALRADFGTEVDLAAPDAERWVFTGWRESDHADGFRRLKRKDEFPDGFVVL